MSAELHDALVDLARDALWAKEGVKPKAPRELTRGAGTWSAAQNDLVRCLYAFGPYPKLCGEMYYKVTGAHSVSSVIERIRKGYLPNGKEVKALADKKVEELKRGPSI